MGEDNLSYGDVEQYERYFTLMPAFLLQRYVKKNTNLVLKFNSQIESFLIKLNENQKRLLDLTLNSQTEELQAIMNEAYEISGKKQYEILANPDSIVFIEINLNELREMVNPKNEISDGEN